MKIAILGAESTGKSTLAVQLADALARRSGLSAIAVPEWLRQWCAIEGRTPTQAEQHGIARVQHERIDAAARTHAIVVCDTTALQTAVYSRMVFGDRSLEAQALALHARMGLTLLTALDLPWVADGLQRDGAHVRAPVDRLLREMLDAHRLPWTLIDGHGARRLRNAVDAVTSAIDL